MFPINLQWFGFSVNLSLVETWMKANAGSDYRGNSADSDLTLWFENEPTDDIKTIVNTYWAGLTTASPEATSYQTADQLASLEATAKASALASASAKLETLGLTSDEIAAIVGA